MALSLTEATLSAIRAHAADCAPRECCGLVVVFKGRQQYRACRNVAEVAAQFAIHPQDYADAEDAGEVLAVVHSHVNIAPLPSQADLVGCEKTGLPWVIVNHPTGAVHTFAPSGYVAPLVGRQFVHGVLDCYSLIRDYYALVLSIDLPDADRDYEWWLKGQNLYLDNFAKAGFHEIAAADLRPHDVILMQAASPVPNHGAVYLGDNQIMQHFMGRLSSRDVWGGWFRKCAVKYLRHRSLA